MKYIKLTAYEFINAITIGRATDLDGINHTFLIEGDGEISDKFLLKNISVDEDIILNEDEDILSIPNRVTILGCHLKKIKVENCVFENDLYIEETTIDSYISIRSIINGNFSVLKCKVLDQLKLSETKVLKNLRFSNIILGKMNLKSISIEGNLTLENLTISNEVAIAGSILGYSRIENINTKNDINISCVQYGKLLVINCLIHETLRIQSLKAKSQVSISNNTLKHLHFIDSFIEGDLDFKANNVKANAKFENIKIESSLNVSNKTKVTNDLSIINCNISKGTNFEDVEVRHNVTFHTTIIEKSFLEISHCDFGTLRLPNIAEKGTVKISNLRFKIIRNRDGLTNLGYMQWLNLKPKKNGAIEIINAMMGKWDLINCNFDQVIFKLYSSKITDLFYTNTKLPLYLSLPQGISLELEKQEILRDGYNQLKMIAQRQNDRKTFLHYQSVELTSYYKTVSWKWPTTFTKFHLFSLKWSNNFGVNWQGGVCFVLVVNLFFISLVFATHPILINVKTVLLFASNYFDFMFSLATKPKFIQTPEQTIIYHISRIFLAFGIYQTISAFRKYGKGE